MRYLIIALFISMLACSVSTAATVPMHEFSAAPTVVPKERREICGSWNVRTEPDPFSQWVRWLYNGDVVVVYETSVGWARIGVSEWVRVGALCRTIQVTQ